MTEPELGLGWVISSEGRQVSIDFPGVGEQRCYERDGAPLLPVLLSEGTRVRSESGLEFRVERVEHREEGVIYIGEGHRLSEQELDPRLDVFSPDTRFRSAQTDGLGEARLRHQALHHHLERSQNSTTGFSGGRIRLYDHQLDLAHRCCQKRSVRVMLADEVGLGKTIEALLILNHLKLSGRVQRALVVVPDPLVNPWFAEAWLRFHLRLSLLDEETLSETSREDLWASSQLFICPLSLAQSIGIEKGEWDLLIVDEVHHIVEGHPFLDQLQEQAQSIEHLLLLSASPDRHGERSHFLHLQLIDPDRYVDFETYESQCRDDRNLADLVDALEAGAPATSLQKAHLEKWTSCPWPEPGEDPAPTVEKLLDRHGMGLSMIRNRRERCPGFPERCYEALSLGPSTSKRWLKEFLSEELNEGKVNHGRLDEDPRTLHLLKILEENPGQKVLALCRGPLKAEAFSKALETRRIQVARFHENLKPLEGDRQAAWFDDPKGPRVLISSDAGSEGRNFQSAQHLVFLDLPLDPDRLEQRIGRLDRIGQGQRIHLHAPFPKNSPQARLARWFHEGLEAFTTPWHGRPQLFEDLHEELVALLRSPSCVGLEPFIDKTRQHQNSILEELRAGRDRILERLSFDPLRGQSLAQKLEAIDQSSELEDFMLDSFESGGVDAEPIGERTHVLRPGLNYHRLFPGFNGHRMVISFDREAALAHLSRELLTWDHPMVRDHIDDLLSSGRGNSSVVLTAPSQRPGFLLRCTYVLEVISPPSLRVSRFFSPTLREVLLSPKGEEQKDHPEIIQDGDPDLLKHPKVSPILPQLLKRASDLAASHLNSHVQGARERLELHFAGEIDRWTHLASVNPAVSPEEIPALEAEKKAIHRALDEARHRLDALQLIVLPTQKKG